MLARTRFLQLPLRSIRSSRPRNKLHGAQYSTTSSQPLATSPATSNAAILGGLTSELDRLAPRFDINANQIQILRTPNDFNSVLKERIAQAKHRIFLSTLYIGKSEHELSKIDALRQALRREPALKVSILGDCLRGTREAPNPCSASLLAPLVTEFGEDRVEIRMYHTPNLCGWKKRFIPQRLNEGWGLQHMKLYGIDDEIIMSGANLSGDYFTNRQDRYHIISCPHITEYYAGIQAAVSKISYKILPDAGNAAGFQLSWPDSNPAPTPIEDSVGFKRAAMSLLQPLIRPATSIKGIKGRSFEGTTIYVLAQFTPLLHLEDTSTELRGLLLLLEMLTREDFQQSKWMFTAGYFNIHPELNRLLLESRGKGSVITAAPEANGFYKSPGISGNLPLAYVLLSRRFLEAVHSEKRERDIELREWRQGTVNKEGGWTYHAKGVWVTMPGEDNPSISLIGSSNYTKRSYSLDLEMNALIVTQNERLQRELGAEAEWLRKFTRKVSLEDFKKIDRQVGWKVRFLLWLFESQL